MKSNASRVAIHNSRVINPDIHQVVDSRSSIEKQTAILNMFHHHCVRSKLYY